MESMAEADPERLPPPFPPPPPPPPLSDLILSLEQATLMAKQLPSTADPTHLLHIHSSLHQAHLHLSNFLSTHKFPQPQRQNSLSSATGNEPMQVGDGDGDGDDDCDGFGEGDSRPTIDIVEEHMRDCFIKNKRPKRRLSASAAALAEERRTNGDGFVGSVTGFDPHGSKERALELVYQFHG